MDYVSMIPASDKPEKEWASPDDFKIDLGKLVQRVTERNDRIQSVDFCVSPDIVLVDPIPDTWNRFDLDGDVSGAK
jgi:CRISPR-associated protein Csh2